MHQGKYSVLLLLKRHKIHKVLQFHCDAPLQTSLFPQGQIGNAARIFSAVILKGMKIPQGVSPHISLTCLWWTEYMCTQIGNAVWLMKVTDCMQPTESTKRYSRLGRRSVKLMQEAKKAVKAPFAPVKNLIWMVDRVSSQVMGADDT